MTLRVCGDGENAPAVKDEIAAIDSTKGNGDECTCLISYHLWDETHGLAAQRWRSPRAAARDQSVFLGFFVPWRWHVAMWREES